MKKDTITAIALFSAIGLSSAAMADSGCNTNAGVNGAEGLAQAQEANDGDPYFAFDVLVNRHINSGGEISEIEVSASGINNYVWTSVECYEDADEGFDLDPGAPD